MYYSRVRIDASSIGNIHILKMLQGDAYAMHQLIWKLFPDEPEKKRDFLFRQEFEKEQITYSETRRAMPLFYVVSSKKPVAVENLLSVEVKEYAPKLVNGIRLAFEVRVNPVVARKVEGKKNSSKHDVLMDAKKHAQAQGITDSSALQTIMENTVIQWIELKGTNCGFEIEKQSLEITSKRQHHLKRKGSSKITFNSIDISGVLGVTDVDLFKETLFKGIGHAKSFGCGLLMVRKI